MIKKQKIKIKLEELIFMVRKKQKPKTVEGLIELSGQSVPRSKEEIAVVMQPENQSKIHSANKTVPNPVSLFTFFFSSKAIWYWVTIALATASVATVFAVPANVYSFAYIRSVLGLMFVLFLPGFTFMKALFPSGVLIKTPSEYFDIIELVALSFGTSIAITPMVGLILYYSPWGMGIVPSTLSLLGLIVFFATISMLRKHRKN